MFPFGLELEDNNLIEPLHAWESTFKSWETVIVLAPRLILAAGIYISRSRSRS